MKRTLIITVMMMLMGVVAYAQQTGSETTAEVERGVVLRPSAYAKRMVGIASYYSDGLQGNPMAGGGRYHRDSMTCAHLHLPFGTRLRVKNLRNGCEVEVVVTDRGPFSTRFVVDLSRRSAEQLGIVGAPFTRVQLMPVGEVLPPYRYMRSWQQEQQNYDEMQQYYHPTELFYNPIMQSLNTVLWQYNEM